MDLHQLLMTIDSDIALVQINRPQAMNALNSSVMAELDRVLQELDANDTVH